MARRSSGSRSTRSPRPARPATALAVGACPCCSGRAYAECCAPLHEGRAKAPTAEALMRSRYSAFALADAAYLERTWHPSTRPRDLALDRSTRWTRLEVLGSTGGGPFHTEGTVEFRAYYRNGAARADAQQSMHENSTFVRQGGDWVYLAAV